MALYDWNQFGLTCFFNVLRCYLLLYVLIYIRNIGILWSSIISTVSLWTLNRYSRLQLKLCTTFLLTAQLLSLSGCSNAHDNQVWSHTHHVLPIEAIKTHKYGHSKFRKTNFGNEKMCF